MMTRLRLECRGIETETAERTPLVQALAEVARRFGIEFSVCITAGPVEVTAEGGEYRCFFIDGKDDTDPEVAAVSFVASGSFLHAAGVALAEYIGLQRRKADEHDEALSRSHAEHERRVEERRAAELDELLALEDDGGGE